eukprot:TRINITY_DN25618_c0_g1_i1.p1 TRINITY_DN25618_c0_g1~~TRINITY_DN25618_c0_g1_i1.p1  ORF type:complete len:228 (+),score=34.28 TRINITY_DN25618_c0_g1_i1:86-769(+)
MATRATYAWSPSESQSGYPDTSSSSTWTWNQSSDDDGALTVDEKLAGIQGCDDTRPDSDNSGQGNDYEHHPFSRASSVGDQQPLDDDKKSNRSKNLRRAIRCKGVHCSVQKHSNLGCAVISLPTMGIRELLLTILKRNVRACDGAVVIAVDGVVCTIKPHFDKATSSEVVTDVFVAWGHQRECAHPVAAEKLAKVIDEHVDDALKCFELHENSPLPDEMPRPCFKFQ